jgi:hypothetical protein
VDRWNQPPSGQRQPPAAVPSVGRSAWARLGIFAVVVVLAAALFVLAAQLIGGGAEPAEAGSTVTDGDLSFRVTDVRTASESGRRSAQGVFVIVYLDVRNLGDSPAEYRDSAQTLLDAAGREYKADGAAGVAQDLPSFGDLNPGSSARVVAVFDVPATSAAHAIELREGGFGGARVLLP